MKYNYGYEKLSLAVHSLASSEKSLRDRLADVYVFHVSYVDAHDVPPSVWKEIQPIKDRLDRRVHDPEKEGSNFINARSLEEGEAEEMIQTIISAAFQTRVAFETQRDPG